MAGDWMDNDPEPRNNAPDADMLPDDTGKQLRYFLRRWYEASRRFCRRQQV